MASTAPSTQPRLPLFYNSLVPLSPALHRNLSLADELSIDFARTAHAVPLTVEEFVIAQRFYPIVFAPGDPGTPLALLGLTEGENLFMDADGEWKEGTYVPAYIRRYPFMLARLNPQAQELSLCFDDKSPGFSTGEAEGNLFEGDGPSPRTKDILKFCEQFEIAIQRTRLFMDELKELDLLQPGEATIQTGDTPQASFKGFLMVNEQKLQELRGDQHRKLVKSAGLGFIYAHLFSLSHMRDMFALRAAPQQA